MGERFPLTSAFPSLGVKGRVGALSPVFPKPPWSGGCLRLSLVYSPILGEEKALKLECLSHPPSFLPSSRGCLSPKTPNNYSAWEAKEMNGM